MSPRQTRFAWLAGGLVVLSLMSFFIVQALRENMVFFYTPTEIQAGEVTPGQYVRIGGLVAPASVQRQPDGVTVHFAITDNGVALPVSYRGILPDLFQEGKGAVAQGRWDGERFTANEVLAKHDENYMPAEAQEALDRHEARGLTLVVEP
ncbi:cytochrome c maturation protein CcmE [Castellaniella sp.]|uniref:cytochrome c maturation protein CcmE n=1 Tax=Castellaniella sp. TaxID=1955812 RepID=UPI00355F16EC